MTQTKLQDPDEVIARALFARRGFSVAQIDKNWPGTLPRVSEIKLALAAAGWVIVPVEPTSAMILAADEFDWGAPGLDSEEHPAAFPDNVWRAMVSARPGQ